jgi:F-type H+-transporting ATPase subunit b
VKRTLLFLLLTAGMALAQEASAASGEAPSEANELLKWANFLILVAGLGYLIAKNLPPFFRSRTAEIQKGIAESQKIKREAEARANEMEARLAALGGEIEKYRANARAEMEQESARIREETTRHVEKLQHQAEQEIQTAGKLARNELKRYAGKLALDMAEQRIRTRLDASAENGLVEDFVKDLGSQNLGSRN